MRNLLVHPMNNKLNLNISFNAKNKIFLIIGSREAPRNCEFLIVRRLEIIEKCYYENINQNLKYYLYDSRIQGI